MTETSALRLHDKFSYRIEHVGNEKQPVLIVDNYMHNAEGLISYCENNMSFAKADTFYPGTRMLGPKFYGGMMMHYLGEIIFKTFDLKKENIRGGNSLYSMVLTPPAELKVIQCLPHCDSVNTMDLACVHYLCDSRHGGTSLYRHKATGYEYVNEARKDSYLDTLNKEIDEQGAPRAYMNGSNHLFDQIASYDAAFNRLVMYRSTSLHSGNIGPDFSFEPHTRRGRLTLNTFIRC
jgi:hypothetical protein